MNLTYAEVGAARDPNLMPTSAHCLTNRVAALRYIDAVRRAVAEPDMRM
jgi:hypothetical protein